MFAVLTVLAIVWLGIQRSFGSRINSIKTAGYAAISRALQYTRFPTYMLFEFISKNVVLHFQKFGTLYCHQLDICWVLKMLDIRENDIKVSMDVDAVLALKSSAVEVLLFDGNAFLAELN